MNAPQALPVEAPNTAPWVAETLRVQGDGVELAAYRWGNRAGPTLLLVHGYPDNHEVWLPLVYALASDYQLVAYDVRGAGASDKPGKRLDYHLTKLANDMEAVILATSPNQPVHVVAHDWGSIQSWEAVTEPRLAPLLASYTSLSGPCLDHVGHWLRARLQQRSAAGLRSVAKQLLQSWYIALFHLPWLPELTWRLGLARYWPQVVRRLEGSRLASNPQQLADGCHGIALYRANFIRRLYNPRARYTQVPVQLLVPNADRFVNPRLFDDLAQWAPNLQRREVAAGHWQLLAEPLQLAAWVREFVVQQEARRQPGEQSAA